MHVLTKTSLQSPKVLAIVILSYSESSLSDHARKRFGILLIILRNFPIHKLLNRIVAK